MLLMVDNYDSFTYNLVQYFLELDIEVVVRPNDQIDHAYIEALNPEYIVLSPGPGKPRESGFCFQIVEAYAGKIPILGVCLGMQIISEVYGGQVIRANQVMHGKTSSITHQGCGLFSQLPNPMRVARYHSLILSDAHVPDELFVTALVVDSAGLGEIMAVQHTRMPVYGVQFHPEAVLSEYGRPLLKNFLQLNRTLRNEE